MNMTFWNWGRGQGHKTNAQVMVIFTTIYQNIHELSSFKIDIQKFFLMSGCEYKLVLPPAHVKCHLVVSTLGWQQCWLNVWIGKNTSVLLLWIWSAGVDIIWNNYKGAPKVIMFIIFTETWKLTDPSIIY